MYLQERGVALSIREVVGEVRYTPLAPPPPFIVVTQDTKRCSTPTAMLLYYQHTHTYVRTPQQPFTWSLGTIFMIFTLSLTARTSWSIRGSHPCYLQNRPLFELNRISKVSGEHFPYNEHKQGKDNNKGYTNTYTTLSLVSVHAVIWGQPQDPNKGTMDYLHEHAPAPPAAEKKLPEVMVEPSQ